MSPVLMAFLEAIRASVHARAKLEAEILALRHQLAVLQRVRTETASFESRRPTLVGAALPGLDWLAGVSRSYNRPRSCAGIVVPLRSIDDGGHAVVEWADRRWRATSAP